MVQEVDIGFRMRTSIPDVKQAFNSWRPNAAYVRQ